MGWYWCLRALLTIATLSLLTKWLLAFTIGLDIGFINPFKLKICGLSLRGKFSIKHIQYNIWRNKVILSGAVIHESKVHKIDNSSDENDQASHQKSVRNIELPSIIQKNLPLIRRVMNGFVFYMEDFLIESQDLRVRRASVECTWKEVYELIELNFYMVDITILDHKLCTDSLWTLQFKLIDENDRNAREANSHVIEHIPEESNPEKEAFISREQTPVSDTQDFWEETSVDDAELNHLELAGEESIVNEQLQFEEFHTTYPLQDVKLEMKIGSITVPLALLQSLKDKGPHNEKVESVRSVSNECDGYRDPSYTQQSNDDLSTPTGTTGLDQGTQTDSKDNSGQKGLHKTEQQILNILRKIENVVSRLTDALVPIDELNIAVDNILISDIPITSHPKLSHMNDFLSYELSLANLILNAEKFKKEMPGFRLWFDEKDTPFKISTTLTRMKLGFNVMFKETGEIKLVKFAEIPNISLFGDTNILSQRLRQSYWNNLQNLVFNMKGTFSSPIIDVSAVDISFIKSFVKNINVFHRACTGNVNLSSSENNPSVSLSQQAMNSILKKYLPLINMKIGVEDQMFVLTDAEQTLIAKFSVLMFNYQSKRYLAKSFDKKDYLTYEADASLELLNFKIQHFMRQDNFKHNIVHLASLNLNSCLKILPNPLLSISGTIETVSLDLSDIPTLVMLSSLVKKLESEVQNVENNYFRELYEKYAYMIQSAAFRCSMIGKAHHQEPISPKDFMFSELPVWFDCFRLDVREISTILGVRSVFMPPEVFSSLDAQSAKDFVEGKLRKVCNQVDDVQIAVFGNRTRWQTQNVGDNLTLEIRGDSVMDYKSYSGNELDDISTSDATEVERLWNGIVLINNIVTKVIGETAIDSDEMVAKTVNKISGFCIDIFPEPDYYLNHSDQKIMVNISNKSIKSVVSLMSIFLIISGVHTLNQIFRKSLKDEQKDSKAKDFFIDLGKSKKKSKFELINWKELKGLLDITLTSELMEHVIVMPNALKLKNDIVNLTVNIRELSLIKISGDLLRLCVEHSPIPNTWSRLLNICKFRVTVTTDALKSQADTAFEEFENLEPSVVLENESWHFSIPHNFEMYKLFDNFSTIIKSLKQMLYSFKTSKNNLVIFPSAVKTPSLPKIKLKSQRFFFSVADDPFESQMNMIFQIGLREQRERLAKLEEFEDMANQKLKSRNKDKIKFSGSYEDKIFKEKAKSCGLLKKKSKKKANVPLVPTPFNIDGKDNTNIKTRDLLEEEIDSAYQKLQENFSKSWIFRIQEYRQKERAEFKKTFNYVWGNINYSSMPSDINKRVLDFVTSPFLTNLIIEGIDIDIFKPSCGVEGVPDFIHDVGKGVPKDTEYSIMVPMYLNARFKEIRWHLRDYPLPFIHIPALGPTQTRLGHSIHIHGNFFATEDMIRSDEEIRTVFVPLVPSIIVENQDSYYSLLVPRTMTTIKIFTDLQFDVHSTLNTQVTYSSSYQPAIQQVMQCMENFSKPPLDPSPKLGFWDKIRYIFHARVAVNWKQNGTFEVALKGSKSPYSMGGLDAGFALGFTKGVVLKCNANDKPDEFLSCTSEHIYFSVPNYFAKPLLVWSRPKQDSVFVPNQVGSNLQKHASYYYLFDTLPSKNQAADERIMEASYIEKTGIKLSGGVTLNLGFVFERFNEDQSDRTTDFESHVGARLCNPIYPKDLKKHDSYYGFRSDFIHMSFCIKSNDKSSHNAMQLSPGALRVFFQWWKTFSGNFPVRRGKLFSQFNMSPKFGDHLYTISYVADVSPLFITHMHHQIDAEKIMKKSYLSEVEFSGLKAKVSKFSMDLHQRKEVLTEYQKELDIRKKVTKMVFLEGDVTLENIDVRTIEGKLTRLNYIEEREDAQYHISDNDMTWLDLSDFQDAFFINVDSYLPHVTINPLLFAPKFYYKKQVNYGDKYQLNPKTFEPIRPFRNDITHNCTVDRPLEFQGYVTERRLDSLQNLRTSLEDRLSKAKSKKEQDKLKQLIDDTLRAIQYVEFLRSDMEAIRDVDEEGKLKKECHFKNIEAIYNVSESSDLFENRYIILNMLLKWNETARNAVYRYVHYTQLAKSFTELSTYKAKRTFDQIIRDKFDLQDDEEISSREENSLPEKMEPVKSEMDFESATDTDGIENILLQMFNNNINELACSLEHMIRNNHFVQFVTPQIQIMTEKYPDQCMFVSSPHIVLKTVSFEEERPGNLYLEDYFMKRYGIFISNANVFVFDKKDYKDMFELYFETNSYAQHENSKWPPWIGFELGFEPAPLKNATVLKDLTVYFNIQKLQPSSTTYKAIKDSIEDKFTAYIPSIKLSSKSEEFSFIKHTIENLFIAEEEKSAELKKQIERLVIGYDVEDIEKSRDLITRLHRSERILHEVSSELTFKRHLLDEADAHDLANVCNDQMAHLLRLYILIKVFKARSDHAQERSMLWDFKINEVILHLLNQSGKPFVDAAFAKINYRLVKGSNGVTSNALVVKMMQVFNLEREASYHDLLGPIERKSQNKPIISISWDMDKPVGGIKVVKNVETLINGLSVKLEDDTLQNIMEWLHIDMEDKSFGNDEDEDGSNSDGENSMNDGSSDEHQVYITSGHLNSELNEMIQRSGDYMIVEDLLLNSFKFLISYRGKGLRRLANVSDFMFTFPALILENQTIRVMDLFNMVKKVVIEELLNHTGKFLSSKLRRNSMEDRPRNLRQISSYQAYLELEDLQDHNNKK